jgi:hypothetical protein
MEIYLILKGVSMVIGSLTMFITATSAVWPWKAGKGKQALDRLSPVAPGALYRLLTTKPLAGSNGNGRDGSGK